MSDGAAPRSRFSLRLWVVLSLMMALTTTASGLFLLYLARPFFASLRGAQAEDAPDVLFSAVIVSGAVAAAGGLLLGLRFGGRLLGIAQKAAAVAPPAAEPGGAQVIQELGALDAAVGRLTLSMNQFVRDSDILGRLPEGMLLLRPSGELLSYSATAETLLELPLERYRGIAVLSADGALPREEGNEALAELLDEVAATRRAAHREELAAVAAGGRPALLEVTAQYREWGPDSAALVLLFRDASEKQRIREEIRRADQLALLGGMAARVAHEIRTPLATIRGLLELLQSDLPEADPRREYVARTLTAVDRQDRLAEDLLTLSNPEPEAWQTVPVGTLVEEAVGMLPRDPRLRRTGAAPAALPPLWGDPARLGEMLTNIVQNACEAAPPDGVVEVAVGTPRPGWVRISVRNTGSGIPQELRERIFQPFFTTKPRGTGLGLAIARHIAAAHHGQLHVQSDGRSETTFVVDLPAAPPGAAAGTPAVSRAGGRGDG